MKTNSNEVIDVLVATIKTQRILNSTMSREEKELVDKERANLIKLANKKYPRNVRSKVFETITTLPSTSALAFEIRLKIKVYKEEL